jgi:hypothetical protein
MNGIVTDPIIPPPFIWVLGLVLLGATGYVYFFVGSRLSRVQNSVLLFFRVLAIALILILLLQPSRREESPERRTEKVLLVGVDSSRSMKQRDAGKFSRIDSARTAVRDSKLLETSAARARLFHFDSDATAMPISTLDELKTEGNTTHLHRSVESMLGTLSARETASALVLLTDGHDFELVSPAKTAATARARHVPIFAVPFGEQGTVRDASISITNFEPYSYAKQQAHISASVRLIGCEREKLTVQLLRKNIVVQTIQADAGEQRELSVGFDVTEPEAGQFEYEVRVVPLPKEADLKNNSTITFLNVIDQRIRVLLLEGAPYWDTTFLRRSLAQNDKIELDAILQYTRDQARKIRNLNSAQPDKEPAMPTTQAQFNSYDLIIIGKAADPFFLTKQGEGGDQAFGTTNYDRYKMLVSFVKDHGGTVVFSRGQAFTGVLSKDNELEPMQWVDKGSDHVKLQVGREGQLLSPFRVLTEDKGGVDALPPLLASRQVSDRKTLAAMLANARDADSNTDSPAMIHRRFGRGQVLSVAVDGLWRWSFNPKVPLTNNVFDRFWDQLVLWLVASGDSTPSLPFSLRSSTANLVLGSKMHFRLSVRNPDATLKNVPLTIFSDEKEIARTVLTPGETGDNAHLTAEFLPEKTGRYRAVAQLPGGQKQEVKWMVFDENPEEKEVAADVAYLKTLCESTGGKVLMPDELAKFTKNLLQRDTEKLSKVRLVSVWDKAWIFYIICAAFGIDWYLRRKWGLC